MVVWCCDGDAGLWVMLDTGGDLHGAEARGEGRSGECKVHLDWSASRAGPARARRGDDVIHATPSRHSQY